MNNSTRRTNNSIGRTIKISTTYTYKTDGQTFRGQKDDADVSVSFLTPCMKPIRIGPERYGRGDGDGSSSAEQTEPGFHDPGGRP